LIDDNPERTIKTVCHPCNNTWMSKLEQKNIPVLGDTLVNKPTVIDTGRQRLLVEWAVKTAMVLDSIKDRHGYEKFYTRDECVAICSSRRIPAETRIWIGALNESHLGAFGTDLAIMGNGIRIGTGMATTIVIGYFAVQVVTAHFGPQVTNKVVSVEPKPGNWSNMLIQLWPKAHKHQEMSWPPKVAFTNGGPASIALLMNRWRMGQRVSKIT